MISKWVLVIVFGVVIFSALPLFFGGIARTLASPGGNVMFSYPSWAVITNYPFDSRLRNLNNPSVAAYKAQFPNANPGYIYHSGSGKVRVTGKEACSHLNAGAYTAEGGDAGIAGTAYQASKVSKAHWELPGTRVVIPADKCGWKNNFSNAFTLLGLVPLAIVAGLLYFFLRKSGVTGDT